MACCSSLKGQSELFGFVDSSALDVKVFDFGFSRLLNLEFVCANKSSCMKVVDSNQSLNTIKLVVSSLWSIRCRSHLSLSWRESFLSAELRTSFWFQVMLKYKSIQNVNCVADYVCKKKNATWVVVSNWRVTMYLLDLRLVCDSRSAKFFAENIQGLLICLPSEAQSRNCCLCLTSEACFQILHVLSIAQPLLMNNYIEKFCRLGALH